MSLRVLECSVRLQRDGKGAQRLEATQAPARPLAPGRVPRLARLLALAHKFEHLLRQGVIADYASLARLGQVSRARITQIMNLLHLAPDIQEAILFLPPTVRGRDPLLLRQVQSIAQALDWQRQRALWRKLLADSYPRLLASSPGGCNPKELTDLGIGPAAGSPSCQTRSGGNSGPLTTTVKEHHGQV
jgi:hypothetical protein